MGLLRFVFYIAIGYFAWRLISILFSNNKDSNRASNQDNGGTSMRYRPEEKGHISDSTGEYIDYEEEK